MRKVDIKSEEVKVTLAAKKSIKYKNKLWARKDTWECFDIPVSQI